MFKSKFYIAFVVILILIAGLSWVAVTLETNEVVPQSTVVQWQPKEKKLTKEQLQGQLVFEEYCILCHIERSCGGLDYPGLWMILDEYEYQNISIEKFLKGDRSQLLYSEMYSGMICTPPPPLLTQKEIDSLIAYIKSFKNE